MKESNFIDQAIKGVYLEKVWEITDPDYMMKWSLMLSDMERLKIISENQRRGLVDAIFVAREADNLEYNPESAWRRMRETQALLRKGSEKLIEKHPDPRCD
jgi:hypothetical protein